MTFHIKEKELEKLLKEIDGLLGKITRFNIVNPCTLVFGFDKINLKIFPIISHNTINDFNYRFYLNDKKLISEDEEFITQDIVDKFIEKIDPLSVTHNVIYSSQPVDLTLKRNDLMLYSKAITIYIPNKLKEFLSYKLIQDIIFNYDENKNEFNIEKINLYDYNNPITKRQEKLYLSSSDLKIGYFDKNRNKWLSKKIVDLCESENIVSYPMNKDDNDREELIISNIRIPGEFIKSTGKNIDIRYDIENLKGVKIISVLMHISYTTKVEEYIFYRYYEM